MIEFLSHNSGYIKLAIGFFVMSVTEFQTKLLTALLSFNINSSTEFNMLKTRSLSGQ